MYYIEMSYQRTNWYSGYSNLNDFRNLVNDTSGKGLIYFDNNQYETIATLKDITGTGDVVLSVSPNITGTLTTGAITSSGVITGNGGINITSGTYNINGTAHTHSYNDLTDKPATFTPSSHNHLWADITDKPTTFTPSTHTHAYSSLTGLPTLFDGNYTSLTNKPTLITTTDIGTIATASNINTSNYILNTSNAISNRISTHTHSYNSLTDLPVIPSLATIGNITNASNINTSNYVINVNNNNNDLINNYLALSTGENIFNLFLTGVIDIIKTDPITGNELIINTFGEDLWYVFDTLPSAVNNSILKNIADSTGLLNGTILNPENRITRTTGTHFNYCYDVIYAQGGFSFGTTIMIGNDDNIQKKMMTLLEWENHFTISFRMMFRSDNLNIIFTIEATENRHQLIGCVYQPNYDLTFFISNHLGDTICTASVPYINITSKLNQWLNIVCVYDKLTNLKVYINNVLITSTPSAPTNWSLIANNINVLDIYLLTMASDIKIEDFRIIPRALNTEEIKSLYDVYDKRVSVINTSNEISNRISGLSLNNSVSLETIGLITSSSNLNTSNYILNTSNVISNRISTHTHAYSSLTGLPTLFDGNYVSLTNKPVIQNSQWITSGNNIYYTTGNIGVNKTNPNRKITVSEATQGSISIIGSGDTRYHCFNGGNVREWLWGQKSVSLHNWTLSTLASGVENDYFTVDTIGKVGIGTTIPAFKLEVVGDVNISTGSKYKINGQNHTHPTSEIDGLDTVLTGKQATITGGATTIATANLTASRALVSDASGKVAVSATSSTQLGYLSTTTSDIQTQLTNKISSQWTTLGSDIYYNNGHIKTSASFITTGINSGFFLSDGSGAFGIATLAGNYSTSAYIGDAILRSNNAKNLILQSGGGASHLYIQATTGNIGIGTITPSQKLDVNGDVNITGTYRVNGTPISTGSSQWTTSGTHIYNNNTGNVGIGTITPSKKLDVYGTAKITGQTNINGKLGVSSGDSYSTENFNYMENGSLTLGTINLNYGWGTTGFSTNTAGLLMECYDNTEIAIHDSLNRVVGLIGYKGNTTNEIHIGRDMGNGGGISKVILPNGNVGIGTLTPSTKLHVAGDITCGSVVSSGALNVGNGYFTGNVGIGTLTPAVKLDVNGYIVGTRLGIGTSPVFPLHIVGTSYLDGTMTTTGTITAIGRSQFQSGLFSTSITLSLTNSIPVFINLNDYSFTNTGMYAFSIVSMNEPYWSVNDAYWSYGTFMLIAKVVVHLTTNSDYYVNITKSGAGLAIISYVSGTLQYKLTLSNISAM